MAKAMTDKLTAQEYKMIIYIYDILNNRMNNDLSEDRFPHVMYKLAKILMILSTAGILVELINKKIKSHEKIESILKKIKDEYSKSFEDGIARGRDVIASQRRNRLTINSDISAVSIRHSITTVPSPDEATLFLNDVNG